MGAIRRRLLTSPVNAICSSLPLLPFEYKCTTTSGTGAYTTQPPVHPPPLDQLVCTIDTRKPSIPRFARLAQIRPPAAVSRTPDAAMVRKRVLLPLLAAAVLLGKSNPTLPLAFEVPCPEPEESGGLGSSPAPSPGPTAAVIFVVGVLCYIFADSEEEVVERPATSRLHLLAPAPTATTDRRTAAALVAGPVAPSLRECMRPRPTPHARSRSNFPESIARSLATPRRRSFPDDPRTSRDDDTACCQHPLHAVDRNARTMCTTFQVHHHHRAPLPDGPSFYGLSYFGTRREQRGELTYRS